jgi:hypothetical protein
MMKHTLLDISLRRLRRILKATVQAIGADSSEATAIRRAIDAKRRRAVSRG